MVNLWRMFQGSGFASGHMPDEGGMMEQPALMMDAFALMNKAEQEFKGDSDAS